MKSSDWIFFLKFAASWIFEGLLPGNVQEVFKELIDIVREITQYRFDSKESVEKLHRSFTDAKKMARIESIFPPTIRGKS